MKRKRLAALTAAAVIIIAAVIGIIAIFQSGNTASYNGSLYFLNDSKTSLTLKERSISYRDASEIPREIIEALISGPTSGECYRIVDKKTKLLSISGDENGNYTADFSEEFLSDDETKTVMAIYAVVKSLCAMSTVTSVTVTIDGNMYQTSEGNVIGALTAEDINLETDLYSSETVSVIVYFADSDTNKLSREERSIRVTDQQPIEQYVIEELIKGPEYEGHTSVLSRDTNLISVTVSNDVGFVNFDKTFIDKNTSTPERDEITIFAIVNSLTELDGVSRVQFLVDGKRVETFGTIDISDPIGRNTDIIE
ncbi:MAG: GerMN domain-containing protein [Firmicutes bacterium]|nr:GerMN domain-containing protein [Bacillota bacterium]